MLFLTGLVTLISNSMESWVDFIDAMVLTPLTAGFHLLLIMILLSIAGIIIDWARKLRYFLIIIGCLTSMVFLFLYSVFFYFLNVGGFYQ